MRNEEDGEGLVWVEKRLTFKSKVESRARVK